MPWTGRRVVVTGGAGFLGRHIVRRLEDRGAEVFVPRKRDFDLRHPDACFRLLLEHPAEILVHSAAFYGGLGITTALPGRIYYENLVMGANLMEAARLTGVGKFVTVGTACAYPGYLEGQLEEEDLWAGPLHDSVLAYGMSKKLLAVQGIAYAKQYGFKSIHVIPTNLYGPWDSYDPFRSHVVAALIRKFVEAADAKAARVECWGTGAPVREFLYVEDAAEGIVRAAERYDDVAIPVNLGTGVPTSIKELTEIIERATGFAGEVVWDRTKPDGAPLKVLSPARMERVLEWRPPTPLHAGVEKTVAWYREHKTEADARG